jgi:integration host factor subunit beta
MGILHMATTTKKDLIDRIAIETRLDRATVRRTVQSFLDQVIRELGRGNRLELRDFGVFEPRARKPRSVPNPRTMEPLAIPPMKTVKFKSGRLLKEALRPARGAARPQMSASGRRGSR